MIRTTLACLICMTAPAGANAPSAYPASDCAAFWLGYADYAAQTSFLDAEAEREAQARGDAYRAIAGETAAPGTGIQAEIARQRRLMADLAEAYIYGGDRASRALFERLLSGCDAPPQPRED